MSRRDLPVLVDVRGRPLAALRTAHEGASRVSQELATWMPGSYSPDSELLPELQTLRDRTRDIIRNHGIASGAVQTHVDNVIGSGLLLNAKPDRRALGIEPNDASGNEAMDELEDLIESRFDAWSEDVGCYCDASRRSRFSGILAQAYRSYLTSFEILASSEWLPGRGSPYATAIQMIDPARLSNPYTRVDSDRLRAGVALGSMGEPIGYHIASRIEPDYAFLTTSAREWKYVPRETEWGRALVIHVFDNDQPGQSRGKNGITSVLLKQKMLDKFEKVSLEAAAFNAMYAAAIESPLDWNAVASSIGAGNEDNDATLSYMANVRGWHENQFLKFNGLRIPHLFPGEKINLLSPQHPNPSFAAFEEAALRHLAAGWNLTYEQISRDYSKTNYSSARAAMIETWRFFSGKQYLIGGWFATQVYALWLEEAIDRGDVELPAGLPGFLEAKTAWTTCDWIGPGRGHIDPLKEENARKVRYSMMLTTLEAEAALDGRRWRDLIDQRAQEKRYAEKRGVDISSVGAPTPAAQPPERDDEPPPARRGEEEDASRGGGGRTRR